MSHAAAEHPAADGPAAGLNSRSHSTQDGPAGQEPAKPATPLQVEKSLSPAARRALAEAAERRAVLDKRAAELGATPEVNGRGGQDPVRYEDWEVKGIAADF